jgi:hypothetical protein
VGDATAPVVTVPADLTREATAAAGAVVTWSASASDAVSGSLTPTCSPASGSTFGLATATVTCTATDGAGNTGSGSFHVTVRDTAAPVVSGAPATATLEATSAAGAALGSFGPTATDAVDGALPVVCRTAASDVVGASFSYPLGTTQVTCRATDAAGNTGTASYAITVVDTTGPDLVVPANKLVEATSSAGAAVAFSVTATDLVDGAVEPQCDAASGAVFALGVTSVTCSATDSRGNPSNELSFSVTVVDTTAPVIAAHADESAEATGSSGATVSYVSPSWTDAVDASGAAACSPVSGSLFALGSTTVTCSAVDEAGNAATPTTFEVHVVDTTAPVIDAHDDVTEEATGPDGAVVTYTAPTTSDEVDGTGVATCWPASGETFPLGSTTVTCSAEDAAGNASVPTHFDVVVVDTTAPVIDAHDDVEDVEATSAAGALVTYTAPATSDAVDGPDAATCLPASGSTFSLGATTVTCQASDAAGNEATETTFTVTVVDTTGPVIDAHGNVGPVEATSAAGAAVTYAAPATSDAVDGPGTASCTPASGSTFALGTTTVACGATDAAGNAAAGTAFTVTVVDTTAPVIAGHAGVGPVEATSSAGAPVTYTAPTTSDAVDGAGTASCAPASGGTFPLGSTTVTCNAADAAGNHATSTTFAVTVVDTTAPVIASHGAVVAEATSASGATVTYTAAGTSDAVDGAGSATCAPASGSTFPLGTTTVSCGAPDAAGNPATGTTFGVTVRDTTAPAVAAHADVTATASSASSAIVSYTAPGWTDAVDGSGTAACLPASGSAFAVGSTTVTCSRTDAHGNTGTGSFAVRVGYAWSTFLQPIDVTPNNSSGKDSGVIAGTVFNKAKAGSAIPVKFTLGGNQGLSVLAAGYPKATQVNVGTTPLTDLIETYSDATASSLKYDATAGQYVYTWKTSSGWAGTYQRLELKLADGSSHFAFFAFTK